MKETQIETPTLRVKGTEEGGARFFRGIPFCQTPRFEKPIEIMIYPQGIDARKNGPNAIQYSTYHDESLEPDNFYYHEFREGLHFTYQEDYLTLNIVTPVGAKNLPVLVFVHGGAFETGTVEERPYGETTLYAKQGIVYVSIGYRLNIFSLYRCGNYGLYDIVMAFRWLSDHVKAFGGNPQQMMAMGQSAGAMALSDLALTPLLTPYVKGMILLSGAGVFPSLAKPLTREEATPFWDEVMKGAGAQNEEELRHIPTMRLWQSWDRAKYQAKKYRLIEPGVDGTLISGDERKKLKDGKALSVPYFLSVTSQDFAGPFLLKMLSEWASVVTKKNGVPVYAAFFDRTPPGNRYKAFHSSDLWYLLGEQEKSWRPFTSLDHKLCEEMSGRVAAFVKTGNPNIVGCSEWKPWNSRHRLYRFKNETNRMASLPYCCLKETFSFLFDKGPL